jgi:heme A synthase
VTEGDWEAEFTKYRSSPEFNKVNSKMELEARAPVVFATDRP